ncbi:C40 family peptidase [Neobacillus dielmonensis]|uniref:C40 family peptidase n=1 Tax=Neobacillus dielmonensis TaxID=1347369 RepID=UPI0005A85C20|nr:C40 family peptidase [Neobacillus dielmonensis]
MKKNVVTAAAAAGLVLTAFGATASAEEPTYTVHPGDSLWKIAQTSHLSINQLKEWNALKTDTIYVNQKLSLTYTVKKGDSLWKIAKENGTTVSELRRLNGITSGYLQVGQQLKMAESDLSPSSYTIQKGDTLSEIGARFNLTVSQLKSMNQLTSDTIYAGKSLNVSSNVVSDSEQTASATTAASTPETNVADSGDTTVTSDATTPAASGATTGEVSEAKTEVTAPAVQNTVEANAPAASGETTTNPAPAAPNATPAESSVPTTEPAPAQSSTAASAATPAEKPAAAPSTQAQAATPAPSNTKTTEPAPETSGSTEAAKTPAAPVEAAQSPAPATEAAQKPAAASSASVVNDVIAEAQKYIGSPYKWAGNTPDGFDCSGYTKYVFDKVGISLPRTAATQWDATTPVSSPSVGDLVFFQTYKVGPSHVGIYLGNNKFISAASTGVVISDMTSTYWKTRYLGAKSPY